MGSYAYISKSALLENMRVLKAAASGSVPLPVVKADAYGHSNKIVLRELTKAYSKADLPMFCLARLSEAKGLADKFSDRDFLIFSAFEWDQAEKLKHLKNIVWTLADFSDLKKWAELSEEAQAAFSRVHINVNTGMNRLGIAPNKLKELCLRLERTKLKVEGVYTHLWDSDAITEIESQKQLVVFKGALKSLQEAKIITSDTWVHIDNSAAIRWSLDLGGYGRRAFRPGIHLWGLGLDQAFYDRDNFVKKLKPVMAVGAEVRQARKIHAGEGLSYGWRMKAESDIFVASVPLGYADCIDRFFSWNGKGPHNGSLWIKGFECPILSTVTMDMVMVKIDKMIFSELEQGKVLHAYWIHPKYQSAYDIASKLQTITYEVSCRVQQRIQRVLVEDWGQLP